MSSLSIAVHSTDQKMGYRAEIADRAPLDLDYVKPFGEGKGFTPLELVLTSLATCTGSGVGMLLRKRQRTVHGIDVAATADRAETHPTVFRAIDLHLTVRSPDATDEDLAAVLKIAEQTLCPVYVMLGRAVPIQATYTLVR